MYVTQNDTMKSVKKYEKPYSKTCMQDTLLYCILNADRIVEIHTQFPFQYVSDSFWATGCRRESNTLLKPILKSMDIFFSYVILIQSKFKKF